MPAAVVKLNDYLADKMVIAGNIRNYLKDNRPYDRFNVLNAARNIMISYENMKNLPMPLA